VKGAVGARIQTGCIAGSRGKYTIKERKEFKIKTLSILPGEESG
jgi:hypothetical protein